MFKNFQEHFERSEESRFGRDFLGFNPKLERIKLLLAAILIPVGCSFFYFLHTGHKYADLESAISNIEISPIVNSDPEQDFAINSSDITESGSSLLSSLAFVFDDETDENSTMESSTPRMGLMSNLAQVTDEVSAGDSDFQLTEIEKVPTEPIQTIQFSGRSLTELTGFLINQSELIAVDTEDQLNAGRSQTELAMLVTGNNLVANNATPKAIENISDDKIDHDIEIIAASKFTNSTAFPDKKINAGKQSIETIKPDLANTTLKDDVKSATELSEEKSRIIMVDKIIGLLKSEIITNHSTAVTGKLITTNRHTHPNKKSFDVNKLESMLEDI